MRDVSRDLIRDAVFEEIRSLTGKGDLVIHETDPIIGGFGIYGDDFGSIFVLELEKRLSVSTSRSDWSKVRTVGDAIDVFARAFSNPPAPKRWRSLLLTVISWGIVFCVAGWLLFKLIQSSFPG